MKKTPILLITFFLGTIISGSACNVATEPAFTPTSVQIITRSPIPSTNPVPASPTQTLQLTPTGTPLPSPTLTLIPTRTPTPFLPADLDLINPQNAGKLKRVAILSEKRASVVAYSPDNSRVAAGLFIPSEIIIWNLASGQELFTLSGHNDTRIISYLSFSPDGSMLASGAQGWDAPNDSLILWDANTGRELRRFDGVLGAISPDWSTVALTQREQENGVTLILYDLASGEKIHTLEAPGDIYGVSFSPQGQHVAAKMFNVFQDLFSFWSVDSGQLDRTLYDWVGFSYSPDGRFIAALLVTSSGSDTAELNIFDATTFKWIKTLAKDADSIWSVYPTFSPDGQILAATFGNHVTLWDTQTWEELLSIPTSGPTGSAFSPDGKILITYAQSGSMQVWGVTGGN